ncbi:MAG: hypothetical protein D6680_05295 [Cyanobacteria bacterium J007]|nr:MAG: hypothetical protein D6680_05295 [Cyanobacteria bacterium J007]
MKAQNPVSFCRFPQRKGGTYEIIGLFLDIFRGNAEFFGVGDVNEPTPNVPPPGVCVADDGARGCLEMRLSKIWWSSGWESAIAARGVGIDRR